MEHLKQRRSKTKYDVLCRYFFFMTGVSVCLFYMDNSVCICFGQERERSIGAAALQERQAS